MIAIYRNYKNVQREKLDLELLKDSFSLDMLTSLGDDEDTDNPIVFNEENMTDDDKKLSMRLALNDYINKRIAANSKPSQVDNETEK